MITEKELDGKRRLYTAITSIGVSEILDPVGTDKFRVVELLKENGLRLTEDVLVHLRINFPLIDLS